MVASLQCHDEIKVCRVCVGWLRRRVGGIEVTPTLPVRDMDEATRFCEAAGFEVRRYDDGFAFAQLDDQSVFDLDRIEGLEAEKNHAGCYIITDGVDDLHARLVAAGLPVTPIDDMPWGMHEFTLTDPSGKPHPHRTARPVVAGSAPWRGLRWAVTTWNPVAGCWCCGDRTVGGSPLRLDGHREVGVYFRCVDWLGKRKRKVQRATRHAPPGPWWRRVQYRAGFNRS